MSAIVSSSLDLYTTFQVSSSLLSISYSLVCLLLPAASLDPPSVEDVDGASPWLPAEWTRLDFHLLATRFFILFWIMEFPSNVGPPGLFSSKTIEVLRSTLLVRGLKYS